MKKLIRGFTLIELLVVIGVIAILAAIVLVAVNPARNFAQARNTQRRNDIYQILNACHQFAVSNDGNFPTGIGVGELNATDVGTGDPLAVPPIPGLNLAAQLVTDFIPAMPMDPTGGNEITTGYVLFEEADGRLTASAAGAELGQTITITR